jgi:hypothetical protein
MQIHELKKCDINKLNDLASKSKDKAYRQRELERETELDVEFF